MGSQFQTLNQATFMLLRVEKIAILIFYFNFSMLNFQFQP